MIPTSHLTLLWNEMSQKLITMTWFNLPNSVWKITIMCPKALMYELFKRERFYKYYDVTLYQTINVILSVPNGFTLHYWVLCWPKPYFQLSNYLWSFCLQHLSICVCKPVTLVNFIILLFHIYRVHRSFKLLPFPSPWLLQFLLATMPREAHKRFINIRLYRCEVSTFYFAVFFIVLYVRSLGVFLL